MNSYELWVDGASDGRRDCSGGWAALLIPVRPAGIQLLITGHHPSTTNNRMELTAAIEGLRCIGAERSAVRIYTDSAYVKNPMVRGWVARWHGNGFRTAEGAQVANRDLWEQLFKLCDLHVVSWQKVKGHSSSAYNNQVDAAAVKAKQSQQELTQYLT